MNKQKCENCRFYRNGGCHRFPPVLMQSLENINYPWDGEFRGIKLETKPVFPSVNSDEWCGEWKARPETPEETLERINKKMENV